MEKKNLQLKLQDKITHDLNYLFKTNEYKHIQSYKKNKLVDFDYIKSTNINKIKFLCHNSLDIIQNLVQNFLTISKENPLMQAFEKSHYQVQRQIEKLEIDKNNLQETNSNQQKKIKSITPLLEKLRAYNNDLIDDIDNVIRINDSKIKKFLVRNVQKFNKQKSINQRIRNSFKNIETVLIKNMEGSNDQYNNQEKNQQVVAASLDILNSFQQYLELHKNCDVTNMLDGRTRSLSPHQDNQTIKREMIDTNSNFNEDSANLLIPHKYNKSERQKKQTLKANELDNQIRIKSGSKKMLLQTTPLRPSLNKKKIKKQKNSNSQTAQLNNKYELTLRLIKENKNDNYYTDAKKKKKLVNELKNFTNNFLNITISSDEENFLLSNEQIEAIKDIIKEKKNSLSKKKLSQEQLKKSKSKKKKIKSQSKNNVSLKPVQKNAPIKKNKFRKEAVPKQKNMNKNKTLKAIKTKPNNNQYNNIKNSNVSSQSQQEVTLINYKLDDFLN